MTPQIKSLKSLNSDRNNSLVLGGIRKGHEQSLGVLEMFFILIVMMVSWINTYVETSQIRHFIYVQFTVCQVYLNKAVEKYPSGECLFFPVVP